MGHRKKIDKFLMRTFTYLLTHSMFPVKDALYMEALPVLF
jgi:hypothetical protein